MRKIENLLKEGLGAKIIALCYLKPRTPWKIAQQIYHSKNPRASKVYVKSKELLAKGFLEEVEDGRRARLEPIMKEIQKALRAKGIELTEYEEKILELIIDSGKFRNGIAHLYEEDQLLESNRNIVSVIIESLCRDSAITIIGRKFGKLQDFTSGYKSQSKYLKDLTRVLPKVEATVFDVPLSEEHRRFFEQMTSSLRANVGYLYPKMASKDVSTEAYKATLDALAGYLLLYMLIPSSLLEKLVKLDEASSEIGLASMMLGGGLFK